MLRRLALLILLAVCAYQQWQIHAQQKLIADLINGLQHDAQILNDATWDVPPSPNIPREDALFGLEHPREQ